MKKILIVLFIGLLCLCFYSEHNYTRENCRVVSIHNGIVKIKDTQGHCWDWKIEENETFFVGDVVNLKMNDNSSNAYFKDDKITKVIKVD